jgi:hypothetical protein
MKIAAVDQGDFHRRTLKLLRRVQAPESAAQDYHAVFLSHADRSPERNPVLPSIISSSVNFSITMLGERLQIRRFSGHV